MRTPRNLAKTLDPKSHISKVPVLDPNPNDRSLALGVPEKKLGSLAGTCADQARGLRTGQSCLPHVDESWQGRTCVRMRV